MEKNLRVAAYARVSTEKDDQANSLASQKQYFASYISRQEQMELAEVYFDEGISGTQTKKRAGFNRMIEDALNNRFDLILTKEVSRFARNTVDTLSYTRKLKEAGVGVIFTIDNIDTRDCDGELRLSIMASLAQEESRKTSERVKWGQKRRMEQGIVFGREMLGYTVTNGILSINPKEAPTVKAIFHKYTNEGKGTHVIARELLEEGLKPKKITLWSSTVILRVLRNEKYVGDLCQKKTYTPDYLTHQKKYNHGEEEMVYLRDHHEPIIDRDLWDRTQTELKKRSPSAQQKARHSSRYWCSGKICCAECKNHFVSRTKKQKNGHYKAWRCYAAAMHGSFKKGGNGQEMGCGNISINERALLTCMQHCIGLMLGSHSQLKKEILQEIKKLKERSESKTDTSMLQKKIDTIETKKRRAFDAMLDGLITQKELKKQTEWYDKELEQLNRQYTHSLNVDKIQSLQMGNMDPYIKAIDEIMEPDKNSLYLYQETLDRIDIHKEKTIDIWLKNIPFGIQLKIRSSGHGVTYHTDILETSFINETE